jgi:hypothetical protein
MSGETHGNSTTLGIPVLTKNDNDNQFSSYIGNWATSTHKPMCRCQPLIHKVHPPICRTAKLPGDQKLLPCFDPNECLAKNIGLKTGMYFRPYQKTTSFLK